MTKTIAEAISQIRKEFSVPMHKYFYFDGDGESWVVVDDEGMEVLRTAHRCIASFFVETSREKIKP